jgi:hypothetical protein
MRLAVTLTLLAAACSGRAPHGGGSTSWDLGRGDGMSAAPGGLVSAGDYVTLQLTPDNIALVTDARASLYAVPLAGGAAQLLAANVSATARIGDAVFVWHDLDVELAGGLAVFAGGKLRELNPASPGGGDLGASVASDGRHVAFLGNLAGGDADLLAQRSDGSGAVTLAPMLAVDGGCAPTLAFVAGRLILSRCAGKGFAVEAYDPEGNAAASLLTPSLLGFVAVPARAAVVALNPMNGSALCPVDGTMTTPLAGAVKQSLAASDGSAVVQLTGGGGIVHARLPDGGLTSLVDSGGATLAALSPDGAWVLFTGPPDATSGGAALFLASAQKSSSATAINADKTTPPVAAGRFSDDSSWVIYVTDADRDGFGPLRARPLSGGIGPSRTLSLASTGFVTIGGARLVYADHYQSPAAGAPTVDLELVDLARGAPTLLAAGAALAWQLSDDARTLAYLISDGKAPGLYSTTLP